MNPPLKPWPGDAIMLVCSTPEEANVAGMDSVNPGICRDCRTKVVYDSYSMERCLGFPGRGNRPVMFFCAKCAVQYDARTITHFADHRGHPVTRPAPAQAKEGN